MDMTEHKKEIKENMKDFLRQMNEEHGFSIEHAKTMLISEAMDSAYEMGKDYNLKSRIAFGPFLVLGAMIAFFLGDAIIKLI